MNAEPDFYQQIMEQLTQNTIDYLNLQKEAGIEVFQLFDTWGGILRRRDYAAKVLPYVQEIFKKVNLPSIYYLKNVAHLLDLMRETGADFLSACHSVMVGDKELLDLMPMGIQGNLYPGLLYADESVLEKEVGDILHRAQKHPRFIFNLSQGVFPDVDVEKIKLVVNRVHAFDWNKNPYFICPDK